jgi:hypothetical protein
MSVVNQFVPRHTSTGRFFAFDMPPRSDNQASAIWVTAAEAALQQSRTSAMSRG